MVKDDLPPPSRPMPDPVARRLVFHVAGYDPMSAETAHQRFSRELARFRSTWGLQAEAGPLSSQDDVATWPVSATGRDWSVETELRWLRWEDVMARLARLPAPRRIGLGLAAFADFLWGGALRGYARHNWRYAVFFLYPTILLMLVVLAGIVTGWVAASSAGAAWVGGLVGLAVSFGGLHLARRHARLDHMLDDWIFAREYLRAPDPVLTERLDRIAAEIVAAARSGQVQEVLLIGHSLGAVLAVDILDRALARDPALGTSGVSVSLATVGSSIPKIGLHRDAVRLRDALGRVGAASAVCWIDYQAYSDVLNFHKLHPVRGLRAGTRGPLVRMVPFRKVLHREYYRRIRRNLFRVHNQFVSANDVRSSYDYFMLVCGPCTLERLSLGVDGAADCVAPDGSLVAGPPRPYVARRGLDRLP